MTASWQTGAALGLAAALGAVQVLARIPAMRKPSLQARLGPYLRDPRDSALPVLTGPGFAGFPGLGTLERVLRPSLIRGAHVLERVLGGGPSVRRRLDQAVAPLSLEQFRVEQLVWGACAFGMAVAASLYLLLDGRARSPGILLIFCLAALAGGVIARDQRLTAAVGARDQRILAEFPTVADLLALAVSAGEGPVAALERIARVGHGELAGEINRCLAETHTGVPLVVALDRAAARTSLPALARFVDGLAVALERGTPVAEVLRAQAADVRESRRRQLLDLGGRKEIAMMIPVVFLVLPVTVVFALFPGLVQLRAFVP